MFAADTGSYSCDILCPVFGFFNNYINALTEGKITLEIYTVGGGYNLLIRKKEKSAA
jgi:hypothetical protein